MLRSRSPLFGPVRLGPLELANRFMRSATYEGRADARGFPTADLHRLILGLAHGGVGLIVPGYVYPQFEARSRPDQTGLYSEAHARAWAPTLAEIRAKTQSKVVFQICHAGPRAHAEEGRIGPTEATPAQIADIIQSFVRSSVWIKQAGADGVQLHGAHGFLLSRFLSPAYNRRTDKYGGSIENRLRIVRELAQEIRAATGPGFFLSIKLNGDDHIPDGVNAALAGQYVTQLKGLIDLFEISGGASDLPFATRVNLNLKAVRATIRPAGNAEQVYQYMEERYEDVPYEEGYNVADARVIKRASGAPLAVCGGLRKFAQMEGLVTEGTAEIVSLSRPFLRQPDLVKALLRDGADADCIHCGLCQNAGRGIDCLFPNV